MLKIILAVLMATIFAWHAKCAETAKDFKYGTHQLVKGNYKGASHTLDSLRRAGVQTASLYCNLGTAYYKTGRYGLAVLSYEKGLRLSPFNGQLIHNLALVNGRLNINGHLAANHHAGIIYSLAYKSILPLLIALLLCSAIYALLSFSFFTKWKAVFKRVTKACLWVLIPALLLSLAVIKYIGSSRQGVAINTGTVRLAPAASSKAAFIMRQGEKADITNYFEGWYKIKAGGRQGWVCNPNFIEIE